jgi:hypothetical protein
VAVDDLDVAAFDQPALNQRILQRLVDRSKRRAAEDEPPDPDGATLRGCRGERDGGCRAADNRDELPPPHSITPHERRASQ